MSERKRWHVLPHEEGWQVKRDGAKRATDVTEKQQSAIDVAVRIAKNNKPSQVLIHDRNGRIRDERTYGDDPEEYEG
jgi:hypothetical protein